MIYLFVTLGLIFGFMAGLELGWNWAKKDTEIEEHNHIVKKARGWFK